MSKKNRGPENPAIQIYTMSSSRDEDSVVYVGKTVTPHAVLTNLRSKRGRRGNSDLRQWAQKEIAAGHDLVMRIVAATQDEEEASRLLMLKKAELIQAGHGLLNKR